MEQTRLPLATDAPGGCETTVARLRDLDYAAYYAQETASRIAVIRGIWEHKRTAGLVDALTILCPRKALPAMQPALPEARFWAYEDLNTTNDPFNDASPRTLLALDRSARYKNILTTMFHRLSKLSLLYTHKLLTDIVPFTSDVQFLYVPLSYLHRRILGHQHWYAFRENYRERTANGGLVEGHDYALLAGKLAPYAAIAYRRFLPPVETVSCTLAPTEDVGYQEIREQLFARHRSAGPIITRLADWVNTRESRYAALAALLPRIEGRAIVYTNIPSHNAPLRRRFPGLEVRTYYEANGDEETAAHVILFEVPIVKSYLFLDVLAELAPACRVHTFASGAPVDRHLNGKMAGEYQAVDRFCGHLWEATHA